MKSKQIVLNNTWVITKGYMLSIIIFDPFVGNEPQTLTTFWLTHKIKNKKTKFYFALKSVKIELQNFYLIAQINCTIFYDRNKHAVTQPAANNIAILLCCHT